MSDRDDDFRRLVPMLPGWTVSEPDGNLVKSLRAFRRADYASFGLPAPDAPLPEAMAFVGRIAEAVGVRIGRVSDDLAWEEWTVVFRVQIGHSEGGAEYEDHEGTADDLAWAACRAAIAAREGGTNGRS